MQAMAKPDDNPNYKVIAENRRARFDYAIEDDIEVGIILQGSEVKSLRENTSNIAESYAEIERGRAVAREQLHRALQTGENLGP
jgi:SsrA-binding protein